MDGKEVIGHHPARWGQQANTYRRDSARAVRDGERSSFGDGVLFAVDSHHRRFGAVSGVRFDDHDGCSIVIPRLSGLNTRYGYTRPGKNRNRSPNGRRKGGAVDANRIVLCCRQRRGTKGQESLEQLHGASVRQNANYD